MSNTPVLNVSMNPNELVDALSLALQADLVPLVTGSPGIGKSALVAQVAKDYNLEMIDLRLSMCAPEDIMGLPMKNPIEYFDASGKKTHEVLKASFAPFDTFPIEGDKLPKGKDGWLLFLDEFNSASKSVQAAAYKLVLDRFVGQNRLHSNVRIVCAGNLATDKAIVNQLSTATKSRLVHFTLEASAKAFINYAQTKSWDYRILGYLAFKPESFYNFRADSTDVTYACPRTWEFMNQMLAVTGKDIPSMKVVAGTIGQAIGADFHLFVEEYQHLPQFKDILANPQGIQLPPKASTKYALVSMVSQNTEAQHLTVLGAFVDRLPPELQVVYFRQLVGRDKNLRRDPNLFKMAKKVQEYLDAA